jgi:hypothetical protein
MSDDYGMPPPSLVRRAMKWCRCCPECSTDMPPCHGSLITGFCDRQRCTCDDDYLDDDAATQEVSE